MAEERAVSAGGTLILRNEDLDPAMPITEVVRGADLLVSTARQLMLFRALDLQPPAFYHCPLVTNKAGQRLAKRDAALSLRALRGQGFTPEAVRQMW
jgi:glutamyl-tRNA synthetase